MEHHRFEQRAMASWGSGHGFFAPARAARADEPEPPEPPPPVWTRPETALGTTVAHRLVLAHTDDVAVAVTGLMAFTTGFEFAVGVVLRRPDRDGMTFGRSLHRQSHAGEVPDDFLRLGVQFADGTSATNLDPPFGHLPESGGQPEGPLLIPGGGGGGGRRYDMRYWVWPLPPPGPVAIVCEWPAHGIGETRAEWDAQLILDAAQQSIDLWPDDTDPG